MTTWVLLRGLAREARHWGAFPALLQQRLPPGDRVLALDLPGNGARWDERSPARVPDMVRALRAQLSSQARGPYVPVALSLGGMVATEWAAQAPGELRGCVLVNSSSGRFSPPWQRLRPACYGEILRCLAPGAAGARRERLVWRMTSNLPPHDALLAEWIAFAEARPVRGLNVLRQLLAAARYRAPARIGVPGLVVASRGDRLVSPRCSHAIARAWGWPLAEHPRAGHDLPLDDPEWLADEIVHWYARCFGSWLT